ncbi:MAG: bacillithiol biosynthesis deacetylase BshB1 [Candidatus Hydrothermales bacterium]
MSKTLIAFGAHPDDVELSIGGLVSKLSKAGYKVIICDLTDGEPTPFGDPETRKKEAKEAAKILGVERVTLDLPNRFLMDSVESRIKVAEIIREYKPEVILTHHGDDQHPDHIETRKIVQAARFYSKFTKVNWKGEPFYPPKLLFFHASHKRKIYHPHIVVDITDTFETKMKAVDSYKSQFGFYEEKRKDFLSVIETFNRFYGRLIGVKYGEVLFLEEPLPLKNLSVLFD